MNYYTKELFIPRVDEQDIIIDRIERWKAHIEGILHRGFTVGVYTKTGDMILQHRKHPVFDNYYDLTASSHQIYENDTLQDVSSALFRTLEREWNMTQDMFKNEPKLVGKTLYKSTHEKYTEHELCHLYTIQLDTETVPQPNKEFAYGYLTLPLDTIMTASYEKSHGLAPWVVSFFEDSLLPS